jgi:hypothetical protein
MIQAFSLRRLHNGEFITFTKDFLQIISDPALPASVRAARAQLETTLRAIEAAHVGTDDSALSGERRELDARRDELYSGLRRLAEVYGSNPLANKAAAGRKLATRMADYGSLRDVISQGDADESADINALLRDLATPDLAAAATLIGAGDWITELTGVQAAFEQKTQERNEDRSDRRSARPENIDTLREKAGEAFRSLCRKINAYNDTEEGAAPWPGIITRVNTLMDATRTLLAGRAGRAAASAAAAAASTEAPGA